MSGASRSGWEAHYRDGQTATRYAAVVAIQGQALRIDLADGRTFVWPFAGIRQVSGAHTGEHARFEKGGELPEVLTLEDPAFLRSLRVLAPEARFQSPAGLAKTTTMAIGALVGVVAVAAGLYLWGIPGLAAIAAERVPVSWEEKLGEMVIHQVVDKKPRGGSPEATRAVERIVNTLVPPGSSKYTYRVAIVQDDDVNAFAAPGGYLMVYSGLLEKTRSPEELAGVLAHEIQHVEKRHVTRGMLRQMSFQLILSAMTGDAGQLGQVINAAGMLGVLGYQRGDEAEADREGMRMMQAARVNPQGMVGVFELLQKESDELPKGLEYLSSHPATGTRLTEMKQLASQARYEPIKLLAEMDWKQVRRADR